jgi:hypothetical protein
MVLMAREDQVDMRGGREPGLRVSRARATDTKAWDKAMPEYKRWLGGFGIPESPKLLGRLHDWIRYREDGVPDDQLVQILKAPPRRLVSRRAKD